MPVNLLDSSGNEIVAKQGSSCNITVTFEFAGTTFNKAALLTLVLDLYDKNTRQIINRRKDQSILDVNGGAVTTAGILTLEFDAKHQTFTANATTNVLEAVAHGLENGDRVWLYSTDALPVGLPSTGIGYVVNKTADNFQVASTSGGAVLDLTSTGSGTHWFIAGDNVIVGNNISEGQSEQHVARLRWTWNDGDSNRSGVVELAFYVEKLQIPIDPD